jgi:urease accessory protein
VRTTVELVAEQRAGATVLPVVRAGGHFAVRRTGPGRVHLIGTAAGPLGGDEIDVVVRIGPGARLSVRGAAATIVLPSAHEAASTIRIRADVADGGHLDLAPQPTIVCAGADLTTHTTITLAGDARVRLLEEVVLGRSGEPGGTWRGRTSVTRDGVPLLRHTLRSELLGTRAIVSAVDVTPDVPAGAATHGDAVRMPLAAGGCLITALGADLTAARRDRAALLPEIAVRTGDASKSRTTITHG